MCRFWSQEASSFDRGCGMPKAPPTTKAEPRKAHLAAFPVPETEGRFAALSPESLHVVLVETVCSSAPVLKHYFRLCADRDLILDVVVGVKVDSSKSCSQSPPPLAWNLLLRPRRKDRVCHFCARYEKIGIVSIYIPPYNAFNQGPRLSQEI